MMKVALVYDRVNKIGGAERVLQALHEIWPEAPLYTAVYNPETAPWAKDFKVIPSFLQKFPFAKSRHEIYPWLTPLAFESFNFDEYDVVISVTSAEAKGIITKPKTLHLSYCLTPTRYLWSGTWDYQFPFWAWPFLAKLRAWDQVACWRPDVYLAISKNVAERIRKYYRREAKVIYPPVDTEKFQIPLFARKLAQSKHSKFQIGNYFLLVSRLVPYKRTDMAIEAFNKLGWRLKVIGAGSELEKLKRMAKGNIEFLGQLTDQELLGYYQNCLAVIFPPEEDFGLVPLEAQSCGKPVVAFRAGGALETIIEGVTGEFFDRQEPDSLVLTLKRLRIESYKPENCRSQAEKFSGERFKKEFKKKVLEIWQEWRNQ